MIVRQLRRIMQADRAELACRLSQAACKRVERLNPHSRFRELSDATMIRDLAIAGVEASGGVAAAKDAALAHFRRRQSPRFFPGSSLALHELVRAGIAADQQSAAVERAHRVLKGEFDLLGYGGLRFADPNGDVRWSFDPTNAVEAPQAFWAAIDFLDPAVAGDIKTTWELNRFQFAFDLGKAWLITRDERYAGEFFRLLRDWHAKNLPGIGINWCSSLELAFRSISWIWAHHFFLRSESYTPADAWELVRSLVLHARRIEAYLSFYFSPNTHLLGEALGLVYTGIFLPEWPEAERWKNLGLRILIDESRKQIRPDGGYFEQSTYYHRYALDFYQHLLILCGLNGIELPGELRGRVEKMAEFAMYAMRPDGTLPMIGDADGGKALQLERCDVNDVRPALSTAAILFGRGDLAFAAGTLSEETAWLLGPDAAARFAGVKPVEPGTTSVHFPDTGWFFLRSGWRKDANYLYFDAGPQGMGPSGHGHADMLGIEIACGGRPVIVDPGTYLYASSPEWRDYFRGTAAHNTATVDGEDQAVRVDTFKWARLPNPVLRAVHLGDDLDFIDAEHDGYTRLENPVVHRRRVLFARPDYWLVIDSFRMTGDAIHAFEIAFHLDSRNAVLDPDTLTVQTNDAGRPNCAIVPAALAEMEAIAKQTPGRPGKMAFAGDLMAELLSPGERPPCGWISHNYGAKSPCTTVRYRGRAESDTHVAFVIYPVRAGATQAVSAMQSRATAEQDHGFAVEKLYVSVGTGRAHDCFTLAHKADRLVHIPKDGSVAVSGESIICWTRTDSAGNELFSREVRLGN